MKTAPTSSESSAITQRAAALSGATVEQFQQLPESERNILLALARAEPHAPSAAENRQLLRYDQIVPSPWNRTHFDPEKERQLIESVREHGIIQDILVRPWRPETIVGKLRLEEATARGESLYELVAGQRRWNAASHVGTLIPAKVRDLTNVEAIELQGIENLLREDLNPIEEAEKYHQLLEIYGKEGISRADAILRICSRMNRERSTIYAALRLLKLPRLAREAVLCGRLPISHAGEIVKLEHAPEIQLDVVRQVLQPKDEEFEDATTTETGILSYRATKALVAEREKYLANRKEWEQERELAEQRGDTILTEEQSAEIVGSYRADERHTGNTWIKHGARGKYVLADMMCELPGADYRHYGKLWKKQPQGILVMLKSGLPSYAFEKPIADAAVKSGGKLKRVNGRASSRPASEIEADRTLKARRIVFTSAVDQLVNMEASRAETDGYWMQHVQLLARALHSGARKKLFARRGWEEDVEISERIRGYTAPDLRALAMEMLLHHTSAPHSDSEGWSEGMTAAAQLYSLDLDTMFAAAVQTSGQPGKPAGKGS